MKQALLSFAAVLIAALGAACLDEAQSHSGVSADEFQALLDRVAALEADKPGDKVYAANDAPAPGGAKAVSAGARQLGTAVGFLPADVPLHRANRFSIKSERGYLYFVPNDNSSPSGVTHIGGLQDGGSAAPLFYASADCTGQGFVSTQFLGDYGASQGIVFRLGAGEFNEINDDPNQFFYVPAGTARVTGIAYLSQTNSITKCTVESGVISGYPAIVNDPAVTGVESAPIEIPVTIG